MPSVKLITPRLLLRPWRKEDFEPFSKINADARVMKYFPCPLNREESDQLAIKLKARIEEKGWGIWAMNLIEPEQFIGALGLIDLTKTSFPAPFTPAVELVWRLSFEHWEKGYETEGALAALQYGFKNLQFNEIVSFTAVQNESSRHVFEKVGMHHDPKDDFDHPMLPNESPFKRHILYRIMQKEWDTNCKGIPP